tara:strand:- start:851 stop:1417 length:567 start_codon:yes stop_codon:yes gene_type:complete
MDEKKTIDFENDQQLFIEKTELETLSQQCYKLQSLEKDIEDIEEQLKKKKDEHDKLSSEVIPDILAEQGITSIKLSDGSMIEVSKMFSCTIPKDLNKREACYEWLRQNNLGDIVKNSVSVDFGKGEDNNAKDFFGVAVSQGYEPSQSTKVESSTLRALYRERVEAGLDMPSDLFHTFVKDKTKISRKS